MAVAEERPPAVDALQTTVVNEVPARPTIKSVAQKSILKRRQERRQLQRARIVLPGEQVVLHPAQQTNHQVNSNSVVVELGDLVQNLVVGAGGESAAAAGTQQPPTQRQLDLAADQEPEELDLKLLWLAREADWVALEELLSNKRQIPLLKTLHQVTGAEAVAEGSLWTAQVSGAGSTDALPASRVALCRQC